MVLKGVTVSAPLILSALLLIMGCSESVSPEFDPAIGEQSLDDLERQSCALSPGLAPSPLITVGVGDDDLEFWPYTGVDFEGSPQDPINLIFRGECDPRDIMSALLSLDGDRSDYPFPAVPPFTCTWDDAIGDVQAAFGAGEWTGSAIQLALGTYEEPRFHLRLFRAGDWTVANAHFEIMIPGTADHQVLSWELAEKLVIADFMRSGLLDGSNPMIPIGQINEPNFREIPDYIYNELPVELRILIGTPLDDVTAPVPIPSDGNAVILNLSGKVGWQADHRTKDFVLNYDIVMPRPFCTLHEYDFVHVSGPVHLRQVVRFNRVGNYMTEFVANGNLEVTPVDPSTGEPIGESRTARAVQKHSSALSNSRCEASGMMFQIIMPVSEPGGGWFYSRLKVDSNGSNQYMSRSTCDGE
jgi:hypothetical protein